MVFSSFNFLFGFLPAILAAYYIAPRRLRNAVLTVASAGFYIIGGGVFVVLLLISIVVDYFAGWTASTGVQNGSQRMVRAGVAASVTVNLSMLAYFKYANFFVEQLNNLGLGTIAWTTIALPIGISFYTFQSMSYTIDIARGRVGHIRNPLDFALYVALFPQLIAGPIVRFHEIAEQIKGRREDVEQFALGALRFSHGLAKKVIIADSVAPLVEATFGTDAGSLSAGAAWIGVLAYTVQIYFDFSGYSDMAIGMGMMFGFRIPENFARPYSALSITDFWRRWHITLSNWIRDYLYIPLGGSRASLPATYRNLVIVFLLTGLWHGANWTFVVWGIYHGLFLVFEKVTATRAIDDDEVNFAPLRRGLTFLIVVFGWVMFRAPSLSQAFAMYGSMFGSSGQVPIDLELAVTPVAVAALVVGLASVLLPRTFAIGLLLIRAKGRTGFVARTAVLLIALPFAASIVSSGTFSPFLYYQF